VSFKFARKKSRKQEKSFSQPILIGNSYIEAMACGMVPNSLGDKHDGGKKVKDISYAYLRTISRKLDHLSRFHHKPQERDIEAIYLGGHEIESLPT
jgi:hypothetical protein